MARLELGLCPSSSWTGELRAGVPQGGDGVVSSEQHMELPLAQVGIHPSAAEEFVTMRTKTRTVTGKGTVTPARL